MLMPSTATPFAAAFAELQRLGYHVLPIMAGGKAPGEYSAGRWRAMSAWPRFRDRAATTFETNIWSRWPDANIGVVLGSRHGNKQLVAVDFDVTDDGVLDMLTSCVPASPMLKKGAKGYTAFYLAEPALKTAQIRIDGKAAVDILTGNETRQTVMPPSIHPSGAAYRYLAGPVAPGSLPTLTQDHLDTLADTAAQFGGHVEEAKEKRRPTDAAEADGPFAELNAAALANMGAWVPLLMLPKTQPKANGYHAVASFRPSNSGRPIRERKQNLSITTAGIKDFGTDRTYSALDLVMEALCKSRDEAFIWLSDRVMPDVTQVSDIIGQLPQAVPAQQLLVTQTVAIEPPATEPAQLSAPGLVGEIADWITSTAVKPQPVLNLFAALTIVGTVIGRRVATPYRTGSTHLYAIGLAPTGAGKDHPRDSIATILGASGFSHLVGPGEFISMPAMVNRLQRGPLMVCAMDEFGDFCERILSKKASGFERSISKMFKEMWSKNFSSYQTPEWAGKASETINAPAMSVFGVSTPESFWGACAGADIKNGLLNRFLLASDHVHRGEHEEGGDRLTVPQRIISKLQALCPATSTHSVASSVKPEPMSWGQGAEKAFRAFKREMDDHIVSSPIEGDFFQRTAEMALRVATIIAAGRGASEVTVDDFDFGKRLASDSARQMIAGALEHMSENEHQAQMKLVLGIVSQSTTITRMQLYRRIDGRLDARTLDNVLKALVEAGRIEEGSKKSENPSGGRPTRVYSIIKTT